MTRFRIAIRGPFSLAAASGFLCGFTPAAESCGARGDRLVIGFRLDGTFEAVAVELRQARDFVDGEAQGSRDAEAIAKQVARILSLDGDGEAFADLGRRDAVVGRLQSSTGGLRPVTFASPFEAGVWGLIAQRIQMRQAATIKRRLCEEHGAVLQAFGERVLVVPDPPSLNALERFPGLSDEKIARLHGLATAAEDGLLDAETLRALPEDEAVARLSALRGVGPWTASHIYLRGGATHDVLPTVEPRVVRAVKQLYQLDHDPSERELRAIAEGWRPFRTWVAILAAVHLARSGEWNDRSDGKRRGNPPRGGPARGRSQ